MKKSAILFFLPISIFAAQHWPLLVDENEVLPPGSDFISENNLATAAYVQELVGAVQVPVLSVNGMTGSVQLTAADLDALTATQASLLVSTMAPVLSVNGQTGNVQINAANIGALGADVSELSLSSLTITGTLATPRPAYAVVRLEMGEWTDYELKAWCKLRPVVFTCLGNIFRGIPRSLRKRSIAPARCRILWTAPRASRAPGSHKIPCWRLIRSARVRIRKSAGRLCT